MKNYLGYIFLVVAALALKVVFDSGKEAADAHVRIQTINAELSPRAAPPKALKSPTSPAAKQRPVSAQAIPSVSANAFISDDLLKKEEQKFRGAAKINEQAYVAERVRYQKHSGTLEAGQRPKQFFSKEEEMSLYGE